MRAGPGFAAERGAIYGRHFKPVIQANRSSLDQDVVAVDLHREASDLDARVIEIRAVGHVVFPSVPRADDRGAIELALAERAAAMLAGVVDRVEFPARVEQRDLFAADLDRLAVPSECRAGAFTKFATRPPTSVSGQI